MWIKRQSLVFCWLAAGVRARTNPRHRGGMGLGLYIADRITTPILWFS